MTEYKFFANAAKLYIVEDPGGLGETDHTVGIAKGCEVTATVEHVGLWGFGSIERQSVSKHTAKVSVKISAAAFDPSFAEGLAVAYGLTLDPSGVDVTTIADTNHVALFGIKGVFISDDASFGVAGGSAVLLTVSEVYFESLPFIANENEYMTFELTGEGSDVVIDEADPEDY